MVKSFWALWLAVGLLSALRAVQVIAQNSSDLIGGPIFLVTAVPSAYANNSNLTLIINDASIPPEPVSGAVFYLNGTNIVNTSISAAQSSVTVVLPGSQFIPAGNGCSNSGVCFWGSGDQYTVEAIVNSGVPNAGEGTTVFPVSSYTGFGKDFIINGVYSNGAFSCMPALYPANVTIVYSNKSVINVPLSVYQSYSGSGVNLNGTRIVSDQDIVVFVGRNHSTRLVGPCQQPRKTSYLWEQLLPTFFFDTDYIFVNPSASGSETTNAVLYFANGGNETVNVTACGQAPFLLPPNQTHAISTNNATCSIHSSGSVGIQAVAGSLLYSNRTQFTLIGNSQFFGNTTPNSAASAFTVQENTSNLVTLVANKADLDFSSTNQVFFNGIGFPSSSFIPSADPSYCYAFFIPSSAGSNTMATNIPVAAHFFEWTAGCRIGTVLGACLRS